MRKLRDLISWEKEKLLQSLAFLQGLIHPLGSNPEEFSCETVELGMDAVLDICGQEGGTQIGKDTVMGRAVKRTSLQEGADRAQPAQARMEQGCCSKHILGG